jgi:alkanesulfonate monooxygenase SsuD/methylene tetrahydromethanopterin reductase-like flavin-dependent oxidoreductase (luciferase family)
MFKEVAKNFQNLKYKLNKRRDELREHQYYQSAQYGGMQVIVKRVQDSVNKIQEWFQDGAYADCDDEIWRAGVDLESLKNMMRAVRQ